MDIETLAESIKNRWLADAYLQTWCVTRLGSSPAIAIGEDVKGPLSVEEYPAIILVSIDDASDGTKIKKYEIEYGVGVNISTITETDSVLQHSGALLAAAFLNETIDAIRRAKIGRVGCEQEMAQIQNFPAYLCYGQMTIEIINT